MSEVLEDMVAPQSWSVAYIWEEVEEGKMGFQTGAWKWRITIRCQGYDLRGANSCGTGSSASAPSRQPRNGPPPSDLSHVIFYMDAHGAVLIDRAFQQRILFGLWTQFQGVRTLAHNPWVSAVLIRRAYAVHQTALRLLSSGALTWTRERYRRGR